MAMIFIGEPQVGTSEWIHTIHSGNKPCLPLPCGHEDACGGEDAWRAQACVLRANGDPLATVHDMGKGISRAVEKVFPDTPDFICHYHFLAYV